MGKVTIRDVASHAGVSIATVSHVINNTRFVSEATKQSVLNSIDVLGYSPDAMARVFKTGRKNMIGFIVPDIANDFFATIIEEIETVIAKRNYKLIVANTKETKAREKENIRALASGIVDGMVLASTMDHYDEIAPLIPPNFPLVLVDRVLENALCSTITVSNYPSVYRGVEQLIRDGHKRIGYITGMPRLSTTRERLLAYRDAMRDHGLTVEDGFVKTGDSMRKSAVTHVDELLDIGCTGMVVSNNVMTMDVYYYLLEKGIPVGKGGDGVDLLGYNDNYQNIHHVPKNIYTVCQPSESLGRLAGEQILMHVTKPDTPVRSVELQANFIPKQKPATFAY